MSLYWNQRMWVREQPEIVYAILQGWNGKKVFLQDGDALVYPYSKLLAALQYLNLKFPDIQRIASYATPQDILRRSVEGITRRSKIRSWEFFTWVWKAGMTKCCGGFGKTSATIRW
ncbi:MAG: hypothetical protein MZV70_16515 [Desulfobacterales bacterium]|nr:hypothetical protein [Desulfobacterales bacterium]